MKANCESLAYADTGYFSSLVLNYLAHDPGLAPFYLHPPNMDGILASIQARQQFDQPRQLLVNALLQQYQNINTGAPVADNIKALLKHTTFTVTTAHQPNILTGPLYFIYKILHAIKLAETLKETFTEYDFVPVYYMGSEDADLDELGHIFIDGEKVAWQTDQSGAVGRMNTRGIEKIIDRLEGEFGDRKFGAEMVALCRRAYQQSNVQDASLMLVHELFKTYGLVVVVPDSAILKSAFNEVIRKELATQFSYALVQETIENFGKQYKVQAAGRAINLFYLSDDGSRERIELKSQPDEENEIEFVVVNKELSFTRTAILAELENHPERFSANVILRGVFQETILPNIAFIGGGGELAYWLELKKVFEAVNVPYPVLLLRNSLLLVLPANAQLQEKLQLDTRALFQKQNELINQLVLRISARQLNTKKEQAAIYKLYGELQLLASSIDPTLKAHVAALHVRTLQGLLGLEKKLLRAEKRKHSDVISRAKKLNESLFPNGNLQERVDNFMPLYASYGPGLIELLYKHSQALAETFSVLYINEN